MPRPWRGRPRYEWPTTFAPDEVSTSRLADAIGVVLPHSRVHPQELSRRLEKNWRATENHRVIELNAKIVVIFELIVERDPEPVQFEALFP